MGFYSAGKISAFAKAEFVQSLCYLKGDPAITTTPLNASQRHVLSIIIGNQILHKQNKNQQLRIFIATQQSHQIWILTQ